MTNPHTRAGLAKDRQRSLLAQADGRRLRRQVRSVATDQTGIRRRWITRVGAWLSAELAKRALRPLASEIPTVAAREPSFAAWIDSLSEPLEPRRDKSDVLIRPIEASDRFLLADGFARLSTRSRQLRFLGARRALSPAELDHLTKVDHRDREALVALSRADGQGIGVARYSRSANDPGTAEIAVTVVDAWHRQGVGKELSTRLITRAKEEGIHRLTALITNDNRASIGLLHSLDLDIAVIERDHDTTEYEITLAGSSQLSSSPQPK